MVTLRSPWEQLEQVFGDLMGTDFAPKSDVPNDRQMERF